MINAELCIPKSLKGTDWPIKTLDPIIKIPRLEDANKTSQRIRLNPTQGFLDSFKSLSLNSGFNLGPRLEESPNDLDLKKYSVKFLMIAGVAQR
tara:strand:- start:140 stop:421 length:282 start_codon:yes stop_codon:yes gene_type:complete